MIKKITHLRKQQVPLVVILATAFFLRFYHLGFQSFWLDELHTSIESGTGWAGLMNYLHCCDQHPPLFFILEKILFLLFGSNEWVARSLSAIAGTVNVWAIYLLGKELYNNRLGLIAAAFSAINFFSIFYAQEARPYALIAVFATCSFLFLIRFIKTLQRKDGLLYALFTLLMLYSHYFGVFVFESQIAISILFLTFESEKKKFLLNYLISCFIIVIGCLLWSPFMKAFSAIAAPWIPAIPQGFAIDYFYDYFDNSDLLKPLLLLLLISCLFHMFVGVGREMGNIKERPLTFTFLICTMWIFIGFFIPFLHSVIGAPLLIPRYTIVLLPAFIILLALGIELISGNAIRNSLLVFFVALSLTHLFIVKRYYSDISKTQFRELAKFMAADTSYRYPVVTDLTSWHQQYYLDKLGYHASMLAGKKENTINDILHKNETARLSGFWITGAQGEPKPANGAYPGLDSSYFLLKQQDFYDAWAQLYVSLKSNSDKITIINYQYYPPEQTFEMDHEKVAVIWDKQVVARPITLKRGYYKIVVVGKGTPLAGVFPHLNFYVNDKLLGSYNVTANYEQKEFDFDMLQDNPATFKIEMDNDAHDDSKREDRNTFIRSINIMRVP